MYAPAYGYGPGPGTGSANPSPPPAFNPNGAPPPPQGPHHGQMPGQQPQHMMFNPQLGPNPHQSPYGAGQQPGMGANAAMGMMQNNGMAHMPGGGMLHKTQCYCFAYHSTPNPNVCRRPLAAAPAAPSGSVLPSILCSLLEEGVLGFAAHLVQQLPGTDSDRVQNVQLSIMSSLLHGCLCFVSSKQC